jgi:hypothetical protein
MVDSLKAELVRSKELLEAAAAGDEAVPAAEVAEGLSRVAAVLKGAGMRSSAATLEDQQRLLGEWQEGGSAADSATLIAVADAILYVETTLDGLRRSPLAAGAMANAPSSSQGLVDDAQLAVLEQAAESLEAVKRAVSAYVEQGYRVSELDGAGATMRSVAGSLTILNHSAAAHIMDLAARTLDFARQDGNDGRVDAAAMAEGFADVLVCLEYFINALMQGEEPDDTILNMAEQSLKSLYAASADPA